MSVVELNEIQVPGSLTEEPITEVNRVGALGLINEDQLWTTYLDSPRPVRKPGYWNKDRIQEFLDEILHLLHVPSAYYGDEIGTYVRSDKEFETSPFRIAAIGGSSYTGLAGNLGIPLVYSLMNKQNPSFITERAYFPMSRGDLDKFRKRNVPMFTLETKRPITDFDLCMFSGSYCGVDINIIKMLEMSGIPIEWKDRDDSWPIIGRGGCHSFSPEPFHAMYDWMYIGDAEPQLSNVVRAQAKGLAEGWSKWDTLWYMATTQDYRDEAEIKKGKRGIPGIYIPAFHDETYYEQGDIDPNGDVVKHPRLKARVRAYENVHRLVSAQVRRDQAKEASLDTPTHADETIDALLPLTVDRVYIKDLNDEFVFTEQVVSYHDPGMSAGTLLVSRGCNAKCSFCQEGMTWMPYREFSADKAADSLGTLMKNTGSLNVLPSAFCASSYTQKKQLMKRTLEAHSDQIKLISQRVDEMAEDPNFVALTGFMGNDTCSLGVEGNSQRVRDMLNKNCSQDELLTATSHLLRAGYKKIKYFMIANIPGETREDVMEVIELAAKAARLRDEIGSKCDIKFSWTPLVIQSFTPMQFCRPTLEKRSLSEVFPKLKELGISFRLGSGAKYDEAYLMQLLHLGDRRIWPIIKWLSQEHDLVHYGSTPKGTKQRIEGQLHDLFPNFVPNTFINADGEEETETIWDVYFHEKEFGEPLSWNFVNVAVTYDYLWKRYLDFQNAVQTTKCDQLCDLCGVCDRFDHQLRHKLHENEDPEVDLKEVKVIKQRGNVMRIRFKVETPATHRFADNEYWKFYFRRALYLVDAPLDKRSVQFASDEIPFKNHIYGVDYVDARFFEAVDPEELAAKLRDTPDPLNPSESVLGKWRLIGYKAYTGGMVGVRSLAALNHYCMPFSEDSDTVNVRLQKALEAETFLVTLRTQGYMGVEREEIDARPLIHDLWVSREGSELICHMVLQDQLSPYDMYAALFPQSMSAIYRIPARRVDSYLEVDRAQEDFFRPTCIETGEPIEVDLFDAPVSPDYCLRAAHQADGRLLVGQ